MKKMGELMKELGFKEGASEEVAKAFIKNLIRQAYGVQVQEPKIETPVLQPTKAPQQLTFDLGPAQPKKPA